ncbi:hypothetical protein BO71DRAFT_435927 [Aspergillus ellipticus CBS 707.79]|uniref:Uncharacterized protein n=1 Tax=Aspergillus ellipticus CBS 707.79 TaxID=1448320 RepID=A0A319CSY0_9EURO|nr:hypothetical protein BO71DRAFT_435927 [Aspergillus ellipticus CBS 707.79]
MSRGPQPWTLRATSSAKEPLDALPESHLLRDLGPPSMEPYPDYLRPRQRWYQAGSATRWMVVVGFFLACIVITSGLALYSILLGDFSLHRAYQDKAIPEVPKSRFSANRLS